MHGALLTVATSTNKKNKKSESFKLRHLLKYYIVCNSTLKWAQLLQILNACIHWPDAVVISVDVIRFVELSVMQARAQVSCHTFSRIAQILSTGTETTLLTHSLLLTANLSPRERAARPVTHTSTGLVYLASTALQRWWIQIRWALVICLFSAKVHFYLCALKFGFKVKEKI